ncbi:MAG: hypothetical protein WAM14_06755 [Candidatus Nitrosopolaris sp.]
MTNANGKSVFTGLLTALHGAKNVCNVALTAMLDDRFALSDLEGKSVNIDTRFVISFLIYGIGAIVTALLFAVSAFRLQAYMFPMHHRHFF